MDILLENNNEIEVNLDKMVIMVEPSLPNIEPSSLARYVKILK